MRITGPFIRLGGSAQGGYSFMEALIGLMIMGISLAGLLTAITVVGAMHDSGRDKAQSTEIMTEAIDSIRLYSWNQITNQGFLPAEFTVTYDGSGSRQWATATNETDSALENPFSSGPLSSARVLDSTQDKTAGTPTASSSGPGTVYHGRLSLEEVPMTEGYRSEVRRIRVQLHWNVGPRIVQSEMSTLMTRYGLQGYLVN